MAMASDTTWVGKKPIRRICGMSDALSIAADLGFAVAPLPSQKFKICQQAMGKKGDDLIRVLRELTPVRRKILDLQVELQGRKEDKNVAHLTRVSEMEKKIETLSRITTILKDVIQNKDRIIARLQQPYSLHCIPVEAEYQKQFSELLMKAASDYGALTASVADFHWSQNFEEPPSVWGEMLRPIPVALASCTRFFEAMSAMRESFATLQKLRVGDSMQSLPNTPIQDPSQQGNLEYTTPAPWKNDSSLDVLSLRSQRGRFGGRGGWPPRSSTEDYPGLLLKRTAFIQGFWPANWVLMETAEYHHYHLQECMFPLTSLQIGDLQSYLSDLSLFLAYESKRFYILVDNRPWLKNLSSRSARIWQLMVTKSRLSPFAKTKSRRKIKVEKQGSIKSDATQRKLFKKWFSLIDTANLSHKRVMLPVKNLRNKFLLNSELHGVLHGFIVFEVEWTDVRGINYLNQLQTDTSFALEAKFMKRWEFDSIDQAAGCISSWFFGTDAELQILKDHLYNNSVEERFFDAKEELPGSDSPDAYEDAYHGDQLGEDCPTSRLNQDLDAPLSCGNSIISCSPPAVKRGKLTSSRITDVEVDYSSDEKRCRNGDPVDDHDTCSTSSSESSVDSFIYKDVLIVFRFNDHVLPFKLRDIILSDLRLLTLLEAGLPSWVIFLQSYPGFSHVYRPWMCPLARALYVTISIITVLIGFYDLYKNVPVLKVTAAHLCGPLLDWIDTWEMATRIKYLGTMLFLHNSKKAVKWLLTVSRTTRSFFSVLTQPLVEPLTDTFDFLLPLWNVCSSVVVNFCFVVGAVIGSLWNLMEDLGEMVLQPLWILLSSIRTIGTSVLFPLFQFLWEIIYLPIRLIVLVADKVEDVFTFLLTSICGSLILLCQTLSGMFRVTSASNAVASTGSATKLRVLWNDLFSHVFRAIRSILNGFVAFFTACNRHRLSIYNHVQVLIRRLAVQAPPLHSPHPSPCRTPIGGRSGSMSPRGLRRATRSSYAQANEVNISTRTSRPTSPEIFNEHLSTKL